VLTIPLLAVWRIDAFRKGDRRLDEIVNLKILYLILGAFVLVCFGAAFIMVIQLFTDGRSSINSITAAFFYFGELIVLLLLFRHLKKTGTFTGRDTTIEIFAAAMIAEALLLASVLALPGAKLTVNEVKYNSLTQLFAHEEEPFRIARYVPLNDDDFKTINRVVKNRSSILKPNEAMIIGVDDFQGYNSLNPKVFSEYVKTIDERLFVNLRGSIDLYSPEQIYARELDIANVEYLLALEPIAGTDLPLELDKPVKVYRRKSAYPRVFLAEGAEDWRRVDLMDYRPGYMRAEYSSLGESILVFSENLFPGWTVSIDGKQTEPGVFRDTPFMSVKAPPGRHQVEFIYRPKSFYLGIILSLAGFGLAGLLLLLLSRRVFSSRTKVSSRDGDTS
jgi:hypothetical protein